MSVTLTGEQLIHWHTYPFPPEEGFIYDPLAIAHWLAVSAEPVSEPFGDNAGPTTNTVQRSIALIEAAAAVLDRAVVESNVATSLDEASADIVNTNNASRVAQFVDGLLASSPTCDVDPLPRRPTPVVVGTVFVLIPSVVPRPVPPEWAAGEEVSGLDLVAVATRLERAAATAELAPMRAELESAVKRLYEAAQPRLG